ncbi:hypothetical protein [Hymenobacter jeollabukensis]|uniref:DUF8192 domain-containing protein n=1 Tax=Hymenobacter jeollabukensis TaxID=2025313 RepID=A0A5R8WXR0_9BACT|nr:hypothetical protein [Hymenobacter jeollabukensis]TLM97012.1 hypothetical protein FDY95_03205 [Hymenobacter jeollabukensis]
MRLTIALCLLPLLGAAQTKPVLGANDNPVLTAPEVRFLDSLLRDQRQEFTFAEKRIAFSSGSGGTVIESKSRAFQHILPWTTKGQQPAVRLVPLTAAEKQASGGYDALVVTWAKVFDEKRKQRVLRALGNGMRAGLVP